MGKGGISQHEKLPGYRKGVKKMLGGHECENIWYDGDVHHIYICAVLVDLLDVSGIPFLICHLHSLNLFLEKEFLSPPIPLAVTRVRGPPKTKSKSFEGAETLKELNKSYGSSLQRNAHAK